MYSGSFCLTQPSRIRLMTWWHHIRAIHESLGVLWHVVFSHVSNQQKTPPMWPGCITLTYMIHQVAGARTNNKLPLSVPHSAVCYRSLLAVSGGVAGLGFSDFVAVMMCGHSTKWLVGQLELSKEMGISPSRPWHGRGSKCASATTDLVTLSIPLNYK